MSTLNINSKISLYYEQFDKTSASMSPIATLTLDYATGLSDLSTALAGTFPITSISSTQVVASDGLGHSFTLSGSGFGPVTSITDLETAISNGMATGAFSQIVLAGPATTGAAPTTLMTIDTTATGYTLTSGGQSLAITGSFPTTMGDLSALMDAFSRAATANTMTSLQRTTLINDLSGLAVSGLTFTNGGTALFGFTGSATQIQFTLGGYTALLTGTFPSNFGEIMSVVFNAMDMSNAGTVFTTLADLNTIPGITVAGMTVTDPGGATLVETIGDMSTGPIDVMMDGVALPAMDYLTMDPDGLNTMTGVGESVPVIGITPGNDYMLGLSGNDTIDGGVGDDMVLGGTGDDLVKGNIGNDVLFGNEGNDDLRGGTGNDSLNGGAGDDWLQGNEGSDTLNGGAGRDFADYRTDNSTGATTGITASLATGLVTDTTGGTDTLISIEGIVGSNYNDVITGSSAADTLKGENGNDTLDGGAGDDILEGGLGNDTLTGGAGNDEFRILPGVNNGATLITDFVAGAGTDDFINLDLGPAFSLTFTDVMAFTTQAGADTVIQYDVGQSITLQGVQKTDLHQDDFWNIIMTQTGTNASEVITGTVIDDILYGLGGDDILNGIKGNDNFDGGTGIDTALFAFNFADATITINGGIVTVATTASSNQVMNVERFAFADGLHDVSDLVGGNQTLTGTTGNDTITGGRGTDTLSGGAGDDNISGGSGNDNIDGGAGNDTIVDGLGNDTVAGGVGNDHITVLSGINTVTGGTGSDFIVGGFQADTLDGGSGNDVLSGDGETGFFAGSDTMTGGTGNDMLMGGRGADTFVFATNDGADTIAAFNLDAVAYAAASGYSATATGADFTSGVDHVKLVGFAGLDASNVMGSVSSGLDGAVFSHSGTSITFFGVDAANLSADDFIFA